MSSFKSIPREKYIDLIQGSFRMYSFFITDIYRVTPGQQHRVNLEDSSEANLNIENVSKATPYLLLRELHDHIDVSLSLYELELQGKLNDEILAISGFSELEEFDSFLTDICLGCTTSAQADSKFFDALELLMEERVRTGKALPPIFSKWNDQLKTGLIERPKQKRDESRKRENELLREFATMMAYVLVSQFGLRLDTRGSVKQEGNPANAQHGGKDYLKARRLIDYSCYALIHEALGSKRGTGDKTLDRLLVNKDYLEQEISKIRHPHLVRAWIIQANRLKAHYLDHSEVL